MMQKMGAATQLAKRMMVNGASSLTRPTLEGAYHSSVCYNSLWGEVLSCVTSDIPLTLLVGSLPRPGCHWQTWTNKLDGHDTAAFTGRAASWISVSCFLMSTSSASPSSKLCASPSLSLEPTLELVGKRAHNHKDIVMSTIISESLFSFYIKFIGKTIKRGTNDE